MTEMAEKYKLILASIGVNPDDPEMMIKIV